MVAKIGVVLPGREIGVGILVFELGIGRDVVNSPVLSHGSLQGNTTSCQILSPCLLLLRVVELQGCSRAA